MKMEPDSIRKPMSYGRFICLPEAQAREYKFILDLRRVRYYTTSTSRGTWNLVGTENLSYLFKTLEETKSFVSYRNLEADPDLVRLDGSTIGVERLPSEMNRATHLEYVL